MSAADLLPLLAEQALVQGRTPGLWPGLSLYRFDQPVKPHWDEVQSLSLCLVARGRKVVTIDGQAYRYDPLHYLVMTRQQRLQAEVLDATPQQPFYSLVLQFPAPTVAELIMEMDRSGPGGKEDVIREIPPAYVTELSPRLLASVTRFLRSQETEMERRVLCSGLLREILFYLFTENEATRMMAALMHQRAARKIGQALRLMNDRFREDLNVKQIASSLGMSESSFAHTFKQVTSVSPIQYLKQVRLETGRELLLGDELSVAEIAERVGYSGASHFSKEFKRLYGESPGRYVSQLRLRISRELH
jgi:AraC-like DNA-binding protein